MLRHSPNSCAIVIAGIARSWPNKRAAVTVLLSPDALVAVHGAHGNASSGAETLGRRLRHDALCTWNGVITRGESSAGHGTVPPAGVSG